MKIAIIGSGPCGLAAAYEFAKNGAEVEVFENDANVGGLAKSFDLWGNRVEFGPHFLSVHYEELNKLFKQLLGDEIIHYQRSSTIFLDNKYFAYPPRVMNILKNLGPVKTIQAGTSMMMQKMKKDSDHHNAEEYFIANAGDFMYKYLVKEYTEKIWGMPCTEVSLNYGKGLIGFDKLTIPNLIKKVFSKDDIELHLHCIYPKQGVGQIWLRLREEIEKEGGKVHTATNIKRFLMDGKTVTGVELSDGSQHNYDLVISTIAEAAILRFFPSVPETLMSELKQVKFRSLIMIYMQVEETDFMKYSTLFIYTKKIKATRITNYNSFRNIPTNNILMLEYWVSDQDELWNADNEKIVEYAKEELKKLPGGDKLKIKNYEVKKMKNAYPIPDLHLDRRKNMIKDFLQEHTGLQLAGRANQSHFNYGIENAALDGINLARQILKENNYDIKDELLDVMYYKDVG